MHRNIGGLRRRTVVAALTAGVVALTSFVPGVAVAAPADGPAPAGDVGAQVAWNLLYSEDFSTPVNPGNAPWVRETYANPFDTIMDDSGQWYRNDYGPDWNTAFNSFNTYRKEFPVGQNGWLTASLSARDWDKNGVIEAPPSITTQAQGGGNVAVLNVPDHTGGAIFRPTNKLPSQYRIEYKLKTIDFGGKRNGSIEYGGRVNGYSTSGCKTQHPWGEGSNSPGWSGDASAPYCEWQDVRSGPYGYNGFHFLSIVDFANPAPRNNHFWHYRRKVLMDSFSQHPDRVGSGTGGRVCNSNTNQYYNYRDGNFNTVNMWISGLPNWNPGPGGLAGNSQWFMTNCSGGVAEQQLSSAAELQPELMPNEFYTFAIERDATGYVLEASGNFARVGQKTIRFHRPFIVNNAPIWHYNTEPGEYDGRFNNNLVQNDNNGSTTWANQWPAGSAYPDYFVIGDLYTNVYEGSASLTDIRLYTPAPPTTTNLALSKPATADSQCATAEAPAKAVNGSWTGGNSDKWCSLGTSKWLRVDLQSNQQVGRFVVRHSGAGGEKPAWNTRDFDLQTSTNGTTWSTVASVRGNTADVTTHTFTPVTARYVRVNVLTPTSDSDRAARIFELEAYAS
ncbi:discoidin domain-containing protein [Micromonospora sp. NBC_01796]|uniref:discoidin domain-containing protein n=1 Tax=Micromonospora sp. NBC_01796 TaxID=2975987 RepID=UPI002DD7F052|nr:discoidin domain-containing protein [Micromonospora sp. NBC_01796]WSA84602.1 discoidin domain-containing protein [Micromonospora sp. NBC_01796]